PACQGIASMQRIGSDDKGEDIRLGSPFARTPGSPSFALPFYEEESYETGGSFGLSGRGSCSGSNGASPVYQKPAPRYQPDSSGIEGLLRLRQELAQKVQARILVDGNLAGQLAVNVELEQGLAACIAPARVVRHAPAPAIVPAPEEPQPRLPGGLCLR